MRCNVCDVEVNSRGKRCPICGNELQGTVKEYVYPHIRRKKNLPVKVLLFLSLVTVLLTGYIDYQFNSKFTWSIYVLLGVVTNFISINYILKSYKDVFGLLGRYGFIVIVLCYIWYLFTGVSFIPNYVIPGLCIAELIFSDVIALIFKRKKIKKYVGILITNVLLALVPSLLLFFNISTINIVAHISILFSIINILVLVLFDFNDVKDEITMIFNY